MKVAWQFIAREICLLDPPHRVRCDWIDHGRLLIAARKCDGGIKSNRALRDGSCYPRIPGNKLPGYVYPVPTGHSEA